ncbi:hypothetical protein [Streptomyces palmae]|uniref:Uncharacterized protein n=1 Tax=Streptomyces palmae TaxID=1701085 RepID=A0A4Z0HHD7_9ACTN|nr:hypothetical protein [Streptomyces palmae]TGB15986.1 hypothetical protein E4099_05930 [Streptomyces palmae]
MSRPSSPITAVSRFRDGGISFLSTASRQKIGTARTDQTGTAAFNSGSKVGDPVMVASTLASGVDAKFAGDSEYQSAEAHADLSVGL